MDELQRKTKRWNLAELKTENHHKSKRHHKNKKVKQEQFVFLCQMFSVLTFFYSLSIVHLSVWNINLTLSWRCWLDSLSEFY